MSWIEEIFPLLAPFVMQEPPVTLFAWLQKISVRDVLVRKKGSLPVIATDEINFGPRIRDNSSTGRQSWREYFSFERTFCSIFT